MTTTPSSPLPFMDASSSPIPVPTDYLATIQYRLQSLELDVKGLQNQLQSYVPVRENELQLQAIRAAVDRIEREVNDTRRQVTELSTKIVTQEIEAKERDSKQRESQDKLQIRVLYGIVSISGAVLTGVLIYFLTHLPH